MTRRSNHRTADSAGFALVEVTLALMLIGLLAALALPGLVRATGPAALRVAAFQVSALLREDRNEALRSGRASSLVVEAHGRRVRSESSSSVVELPYGTAATITGTNATSIGFFGNGRSTGGDLVIASAVSGFIVSVSADTGAIHVAAP